MKIKVMETKEREIEVSFVRISVPVRYDEEQIPNDFPLRKNDVWDAVIEADTGRILDWPIRPTSHLHLKVVDEGCYYLLDSDKKEIASIEQDYVPHGVVPGSYGDYVELDISETGVVTNWKKRLDASAFFPEQS